MVRLTVKEIYELQEDIQRTGEVNATVMTRDAFIAGSLFIAWARSAEGEEFYLAIWRNNDSWIRVRNETQAMGEIAYHMQRLRSTPLPPRPKLPKEVVEDG